ncbi:MAG: ABC transporter permease [Nitrospinae bacterium]|nr:ABC transporter permease [Nitrospinota bacterium]
MLFLLSWRNLARRKRRAFITALTVALGVFLSVTFTALGDYSYTNMINTSAKMGFGHVTVEAEGYNVSPALDKRIGGVSDILKLIRGADGVESAVSRITGQAMFSTASRSVGGVFMAIDPKVETQSTTAFLGAISGGEMFNDVKGRGAVLGVKLMEKLNLKKGGKFVYTTTGATGDLVSESARVTGVFKTGVEEVDGSFAILPIGRLQGALGYTDDEATMVVTFIKDHRNAEGARAVLQSALSGRKLEVLTWSQTQADLAGHVAVDQAVNYIYQFLMGVMIAAGILNTVMMGVLERWREFGVMVAVGFKPSRLSLMVIIESLWLGIMGLILGVIVTAPWYVYMSRTGIDLSGYMQEGADVSGILVDPVLKFRLYKESVVGILAGVFALTALAGLYPAWKAGRTNPVDTLKNL